MTRRHALTAALALAAAVFAAACAPPLQGNFTQPPPAVNEWLPIKPGATWTYQGVEEGIFTTDIVTVTGDVQPITDNGITVQANVVTDMVYRACAGPNPSPCFYLAERTRDFFATADDGTVWYLGEETAELDRNGNVTSTAGSWQAGVGGAHGGIFMPANPQVGQAFQQENAADAKDFFQIVWLLYDTMVTREWSPLEPGVTEFKTYVRHVGLQRDGGLVLVSSSGL